MNLIYYWISFGVYLFTWYYTATNDNYPALWNTITVLWSTAIVIINLCEWDIVYSDAFYFEVKMKYP